MKTIPTRQWKKIWAIHFLFYFISNCKDSIENNDVFEPVANLRSRTQWISLIKEMIPEQKIARMKAARNCCDRLDLEHSRAEILREIWQAPYARGRLRRLLMMILSQEIDAHEKTSVVTIDKEGRISLGEDSLTLDALAQALSARLAENPKLSLVVRGDKEADYGKVMEVVLLARRLGVEKPLFATNGRE